jgi:hypothetical protein
MKKLLKSLKVGERSLCDVKKEFIAKNDKAFCDQAGVSLEADLQVLMELHEFVRADDYYHDKTTKKKQLKSGKMGTRPAFDSTVECKTRGTNA